MGYRSGGGMLIAQVTRCILYTSKAYERARASIFWTLATSKLESSVTGYERESFCGECFSIGLRKQSQRGLITIIPLTPYYGEHWGGFRPSLRKKEYKVLQPERRAHRAFICETVYCFAAGSSSDGNASAESHC